MHQRQLIEVDPQRIKFNPLNPRKHRGTELIRLRASIKAIGIVQLPTVRVLPGGFYEVIDGEGRVSIAQEEHFEKIWVVSVGIIDEQEALMMLQSANTMRSYNFLAECKGLAALHRQGNTLSKLSSQFGVNPARIGSMVGVGYFPEDLITRIQENIASSDERSDLWSETILTNSLPLRELLPGKEAAGRNPRESGINIYGYREVVKAIDKVMCGEITNSEQMRVYVVYRKSEIFQERFDQDLRRRLGEELLQARKDLDAVKEKEIHAVEEKAQRYYEDQIVVLQAQLDGLQKRNNDLVNDVAKYPEKIAEREQELETALEKAARERREIHDRQVQMEEDLYRDRVRLQEEQKERQLQFEKEIKQTLDDELVAQQEEQKRQLKKTEADLKSYYAQKDEERKLKAENTIRSLLSFGVKSLAESQQTLEHIISEGMLQGVQQLGGAQHESLLWAVRSMQETLDRVEGKLTYKDAVMHVERGIVNGHV